MASSELHSPEKIASLRKLQLLTKKRELIAGLPHLYGQKMYPWMRDFFECRNRMMFLCAGNQVGKSSALLRKLVYWATSPKLWPGLWGVETPRIFWYLLPTAEVADVEIQKKWIPEILPRNEYKEHKLYGWHIETGKRKADIVALHFNSGVSIYLKSYAQKAAALQTASPAVVACFVAGTMIATPSGPKDISEIKPGDLVYSHLGVRKVRRIFSKTAEVISRKFSDGRIITATPDHPFVIDGRCIPFSELTEDYLYTSLFGWKIQKKSSFLMARFTRAVPKLKIIEVRIIFALAKISFYMLPCGKWLMVKKCRNGMLFTTQILIHWITGLKIFSYLLGLNILGFIKSVNGDLRAGSEGIAYYVNLIFGREVVSLQPVPFVLESVGENIFTLGKIANIARMALKQEKKIIIDSVQKHVPINSPARFQRLLKNIIAKNVINYLRVMGQNLFIALKTVIHFVNMIIRNNVNFVKRNLRHILNEIDFVPIFVLPEIEKLGKNKVYNLEIEEDHTFFAEGILVHNCDEELPVDLFSELRARLQGTHGHFMMVFTATLGQPEWKEVIEGDKYPDSWKRQISLYDCQYYEDGTPSKWTSARIKEEIESCISEAEVKRRIFGKFVKSEGMRYPGFERRHNVRPSPGIPPIDWIRYAGVDLGSGGSERGHPSAITFIAVRPDFKKARVYRHWNGRGQGLTTAADTYTHFNEMRGDTRFAGQAYDFSCKDFYTIASRLGDPFTPANKGRTDGDATINSLFKHQILDIDDIEENYPLIYELEALTGEEQKAGARDDSVDSLRYNLQMIPFDWTTIMPLATEVKLAPMTEAELRKQHYEPADEFTQGYEQEIEEWQSYMDI